MKAWSRVLIYGCRHGHRADRAATKALLEFREKFKPQFVADLGDFIDTAAFRAGSKGDADEAEPIQPDLKSGLEFIEQMRPNVILCGNHEARLWRLAGHYNAIVAELAQRIIGDIQSTAKKLKATLIPYTYKAHYPLANCRLMHGEFFNESATRDHAEAYAPQGGIVVHAHTHRAGYARGRRADNPAAFCVGTLAAIPNMEYAAHRRSTLAWSGGFVYGETNGERCQLYLHDNGQEQLWRLPSV